MTAPTTPPAPVGEKGYATTPQQWWASTTDEEETPELRWPLSVPVFDRMRRTDAQIRSVLRAVTLPVLRTSWRLDATGCRPEVADLVSADLNLPIVGGQPQPPVRTRGRFSWPEHLRLALLMLPFGHAVFEQVARVDEQGRQRLAKLALRPSRTIAAWNVAPDGGLVSIAQWTADRPVEIPVSRLVVYSYEREGGNWVGQSLIRPAYKNWLLKDRLLRVQAQTIDRNGMGVPVYTGAEGETDLSKGQAIATGYRSGSTAGAALPNGAKLELKGVEGTLPDANPAIRYHDEQIARAVLAHFLNLGTQTGSWALGSTFADFFVMSLQALAEQVADVANQHVVEDLVDWNFGPDEPAPRIVFEEIGSRQAVTAEAIKALVDSGVIYPDRLLEETVRQLFHLPGKDPSTSTATG